jgi:hypothetical protein
MKPIFTAALIITIFSSVNAQWYMAAEDGISIRKITQNKQVINYATSNTVEAVSEKPETIHPGALFIGGKLGYEFNPFLIEIDGKLNPNLSGMTVIYSGVILSLNSENNFSFTPLIGASLNHLDFSAGARLQYKHFYLEANKTGNTTFYFTGFKCYLYE